MKFSEHIKPQLIGILNVTPDSFSDGGDFADHEAALLQAEKLNKEGAVIIDIGGDSTRPGSVCTGVEEEWRRIGPLIARISRFSIVSVDTHHAEVAEKAIKEGASIINDVSSGYDPKMFETVAASSAKIILTYTRCPKPHDFSQTSKGDIIENIKKYFQQVTVKAKLAGISNERIILDPGMGAFLSDQAQQSWNLLARLRELENLGYPLALGISRKGFLKTQINDSNEHRDMKSAMIAGLILNLGMNKAIAYLRVHNAAMHRQFIT